MLNEVCGYFLAKGRLAARADANSHYNSNIRDGIVQVMRRLSQSRIFVDRGLNFFRDQDNLAANITMETDTIERPQLTRLLRHNEAMTIICHDLQDLQKDRPLHLLQHILIRPIAIVSVKQNRVSGIRGVYEFLTQVPDEEFEDMVIANFRRNDYLLRSFVYGMAGADRAFNNQNDRRRA